MVESVENHAEFNTEPDDKGQLNEKMFFYDEPSLF